MDSLNAKARGRSSEWPYPIEYDQSTTDRFDVLVVGGGIAGCHAAINAAREGARVAVLDKGAVIRSGSGGAGCDHWHAACTNPCSGVTPDDLTDLVRKSPYNFTTEYGNFITSRIVANESYEALLDLERMGVTVRDVDDDFVGADFRDEETKLLFAYDYQGKHCLRVQGWNIKPALHRELKRLGVAVFDRVMGTSLLTEDGQQGSRVVGATGVNVRTGRFYVLAAKAVVLATARPFRLWVFSTETKGLASSFFDPNCAGDGCAMAWRAGAELTLMEMSAPSFGPFHHVPYGVGNAHNTWYACNIVDSNGREVPWVDRDGRELNTLRERYLPVPGQKFFLFCPDVPYEYQGPMLAPALPVGIAKGEFVLPLYADLPSMPPDERRAIWGLMVGHEGNTRIPVYAVYGKAGFDPDKDMLQANVLPPSSYAFKPWWIGEPVQQLREWGRLTDGGGVLFDWNLRTSLEGLYAAGEQLAAGANHAASSATGRYAGRNAAAYAEHAAEPQPCKEQVGQERTRVLAPIGREGGMGWKEVQAGLSRVMQDYCGEFRSEKTLGLGLEWLDSVEQGELSSISVRNPHELMRALEVAVRLEVGRAAMHASLARRASSTTLGFKRVDFPEMDPQEWMKLIAVKQLDDQVVTRSVPCDYPLSPPYSTDCEENYQRHAARQRGGQK
jgi:succinate dehydrogenase/fumarate reductase flavoprotein subunit